MKHLKIFLAATTAATTFTAMVATPVIAQEITSGVQGRIADQAGKPIAGASVTVKDTRTGAERTLTANADGNFSASGLTTGGPYQVTTTAPGFEGQTLDGVNLSLQGATNLEFSLTPSDKGGVIVVTGTRVQVTQSSVGPGTSFSTAVLANAPSFNRDVRDVIRIDPRVSLDRDDGGSGQDRISCLGGNDRGNMFTVDGIPQNDIYGLNDTGFSSRSSTPLPYDAIRETQVQFAPFDVDYGQFTGCAINVVTKSGTNQIHFGGFGEYSDAGMRAKSFNDRGFTRTVAPIKPEKRYGGYFSGPIIKDRLFVFGAYEHHEAGQSQDDGPTGAGYANDTGMTGVSLAQFNEIRDVLKTTYGIDTGDLVYSRPYKNDRYFLRADLQINDKHRLEAGFQHLKESTLKPDDLFTGNSPQAIGMNTFFLSGTKSYYYTGRLYSQWSDAFSTEIRYARSKIQDLQDPFGGGEAQSGTPIPRIIVGVDNATGTDGAVLAGPGINRAGNDLRTTVNQYRAVGKVVLGNHKLKFGAELNQAQLYNLFVANATGTLAFRNLADLKLGLLSPGTGNNQTSTTNTNLIPGFTEGAFGNFSATGDINDAAAEFSRSLYSAYVQDNWSATEKLELTAGVRVDWFDGSRPDHNPVFAQRYGITNSSGFSKLDPVVLPRVAFSYKAGNFGPLSRMTLRGGVGIFSGGDPLVWFGNVFQNDGSTFALGTTQAAGCPAGQISVLTNGKFTGVPTCMSSAAQATAASNQGNTQSLSPGLKMPTVLRANFGIQGTLNLTDGGFLSGWNVNLDYIYSKYINPLNLVDLAEAIDTRNGLNGYTIDGRPIYKNIDLLAAGCSAKLTGLGSPPVFTGLTAACFPAAPSRGGELMITNQKGYRNHIASFLLSKSFSRGLITEGGSTYVAFGYAYTDAQDRRSFYDSTAGSLYGRNASFDRPNPGVSTGFFQTRHNITFSANFRNEFFKDLGTSVGFTFVARSGRPYSYTFTGSGVFNPTTGGLTVADSALAYIPNGVNDPNLSPNSNAAAVAALVDFVNNDKCAKKSLGKTITRNTCNLSWYKDLDLSISQELPGPGHLFGRHDKIRVYAMFDNFLNLLNKGWNLQYRRNFYGVQDIATVTAPDAQGRYVISSAAALTTLNAEGKNTIFSDNAVNVSSSVWRIKVGVSYNF